MKVDEIYPHIKNSKLATIVKNKSKKQQQTGSRWSTFE